MLLLLPEFITFKSRIANSLLSLYYTFFDFGMSFASSNGWDETVAYC
jgi:hypothetical protein